MLTTKLGFLVALVILCVSAGEKALADVVLYDGGGGAYIGVRGGAVWQVGPTNWVVDNPTSLPYSHTVQGTSGASVASGTFDFSNTGFHYTLNNSRPAPLDAWAGTGANIYFSVTTDTAYSASGVYTSVDTAPHPTLGQAVELIAKLVDIDTNTVLFDNDQQSNYTFNQSFTLGQTAGDWSNRMQGSLTGTLLAGHHYNFNSEGYIYASNYGPGMTATGSGSINLALTSVVPLPSAVWTGLVLLGVLGLVRCFGCKRNLA